MNNLWVSFYGTLVQTKKMHLIKYIYIIFFLVTGVIQAQVTQVSIPRIELMPKVPAPFNVRDWSSVAMKYDSFVYDLNKTGLYLPFIHLDASGINYPQNPAFGLHTYVGTNTPSGNEAINVLPSLVGATLNGIDKSNQFGYNWVLMSQDFFNKKNGELIYLNNRNGSSGGDWWYDMMPNVYFYQLYDQYPGIGGDATFQFTSVADRFLESVRNLNGSDTPWKKANMNFRAYNFKKGQPLVDGVKEPEAAGVYAWILYNAYTETGNLEYLKGSEWSMEFLNELSSNPSYELQLPYGTYTAARMNAELGTEYNIEKMVNWSFDKGPLRGWGTIVGKWGGFDVSGVVGEANDQGNDYAFQMNGLQQAAMLVPMVRYDKRFAKAIGKWVLNLANATRLFYPGFLLNSLQDSYAWSEAYDPDHVIGYEALREKWMNKSPFSTGDAINGGWAKTNLALYGTSSIGYLGAIIKRTNINEILQLDLLKTDFFRASAYPTYLYYNPTASIKQVEMEVGSTPVNIYDAVTESFILQNVSGKVNLNIASEAVLLVSLTPASGTVTYQLNKMLVDGVVVDYNQSAFAFPYPPRIQALATDNAEVEFGDSTTIYSKEFDKDSNTLSRKWTVSGGKISGTGSIVEWIAPNVPGDYTINLIVSDESGNADTASLLVKAVAEINLAPEIIKIQKSGEYTIPNGSLQLTCIAADPNDDLLNYNWTTTGGSITGSGSTVTWIAPPVEGIYQVTVKVTDEKGLFSQATTNILVKVFSSIKADLIAYYPFSGNANDHSGNQLHGTTSGALIVNDLSGEPFKACLFDGVNDKVTVLNDPKLNFTDAITVSLWTKPGVAADHETFLLSHGSWQNRWKISITPEQKIRWTLNSLISIGDLDSEIKISKDSVYFITVSYDGSLMAMYLNGTLHSYRTLSGKIRTSPVDLTMGQMLPDNTEYNYKGLIDEVRIMDYAMHPDEVKTQYEKGTTAYTNLLGYNDLRIFPNPVNQILSIEIPGPLTQPGKLSIIDLNGVEVYSEVYDSSATLDIDLIKIKPGFYIITYSTGTIKYRNKFIKI